MTAFDESSLNNTEGLRKAALETSQAVLLRQRRVEQEVLRAKADLECLARHQARSLSLLNATLDASPDGIVAFDLQGELVAYNANFEKLWGFAPQSLKHFGKYEILEHCERQVRDRTAVLDLAPRSVSCTGLEVAMNDGRVFERHVSHQILNNNLSGHVVHWRDISDRKRAEQLIWYQANFDNLTKLPNRAMFNYKLAQEILVARRHQQKFAVMLVDLDKFKEVNDTFGHEGGDMLLVEAAHRIQNCLRVTDVVARMGGDEFIVLLSGLVDPQTVSDISHRVLSAISQPFNIGDAQAVVSGSIGITVYPDDTEDGDTLLRNADKAMYVSKEFGSGRASYFTQKLEIASRRRIHLIRQLRQALLLSQFTLHFQPIVDIHSGRLCKAEALIRWDHPELGSISPVEFIPLAEDSGLIVAIGDWVFNEAVDWVKHIRERFQPDFSVSINKSPVQFNREIGEQGSWAPRLFEAGLPGDCVVMEITEGLLMEASEDVRETLLGYRKAGIQVAIDDFGTGYSSLSYLKRFNVDYVKIDRSFTSELGLDTSDLALTQAIIVMAHTLGLKVIAEGVETELQRSLLAAAGCDYAQGYLFSRPVPPTEFEALFANIATTLDGSQSALVPDGQFPRGPDKHN